jgi:hypothetical protein
MLYSITLYPTTQSVDLAAKQKRPVQHSDEAEQSTRHVHWPEISRVINVHTSSTASCSALLDLAAYLIRNSRWHPT